MSEKTTRLYELGYLLAPAISEVDISKKVDSLKALIISAEGEVFSEGNPEYIDLAYTIEKTFGSKTTKYSQAYFGFIKFETQPESLESLKKSLDADTDLVRYLLIKTDKENTIIFKKPKIEAKRGDIAIDESELDSDESVDDIIAAHEALPDLMPEIESDAKEEDSE